jgi:phospholipid/cholesterol/gamma-HCH transport system substrate-binding protein
MRVATQRTSMLVGAAVLAALVGAVYLALTASRGLPGQDHRLVRAEFSSVGGLRVGDDVRKASVRIGQVREVELDGNHAVVTMQLDADAEVYGDARAAVQSRSALGQNFVALDAGDPATGPLARNDSIPQSRTTPPTTLDEALSSLDRKTRTSLAATLQQVGGGLVGHSQDVHDAALHSHSLLRNLGAVAQAASADPSELAGLIQSTGDLAARFHGREDRVASLVDNLGRTLDAIAVDDGAAVEGTLKVAPATLDQVRSSMVDLRAPVADLERAMVTLRPGSFALGQATPDLRGTLRESVGPLGRVTEVAQKAVPAVGSLNHLMIDARPLVNRLEKTFASTHEPSAVLAPYAPEIAQFFTYWVSANKPHDASGHYLRINLVLRPESLDGVLPVRDPFVHRNAYPAPGQAQRDRATSIFGGN